MSSMRKPKRITIRGDDEKEYMFLVKGGEDLRLDQRIEQVLASVIDLINKWVWLILCCHTSQKDSSLIPHSMANTVTMTDMRACFVTPVAMIPVVVWHNE